LKQELKTAYWKTSGLPENEFLVYAEYCASGIIGIYTDWLAGNNPLSLEELVEIASDAVECGWQKMQG
jgi:hypothetical protein